LEEFAGALMHAVQKLQGRKVQGSPPEREIADLSPEKLRAEQLRIPTLGQRIKQEK
jgi:hypothetical protein